MRKVNLDVEATIMLPVKVNLSLIIRADDDADISKELIKISSGKKHPKSDMELCDIEEILRVGDDVDMLSNMNEIVLEELQRIVEEGSWMPLSVTVIDSK